MFAKSDFSEDQSKSMTMNLLENVKGVDWNGVIYKFVICMTLLSIFMSVVYHPIHRATKEQENWDAFTKVHICKKTGETHGFWVNTTTWLCDDGISYTRNTPDPT